ncbi:hypothetical protein FQN54_006708 [Arachnomyces sp. PD_36]|nr:hypothetical protein FQN54_006708 [Arachnomyces sp. PD_36]
MLLGLLVLLTSLVPAALSRPPISPPSHGDSEESFPVEKYTAQEVIEKLDLIPNEEKGYYKQTFEDPQTVNNRSISTAIYYLLEGSVGRSIWHRVDAPEIWHYYAGAPLTMRLSRDDGQPVREMALGPNIFNNQQPQVVVGKQEWQSAQSWGNWTLVGTTVAPGFVPSGVELAPPDWQPNGA